MTKKKIGLIAGNGKFPILFATRAIELGYTVTAVAHKNETLEGLETIVPDLEWIHVGQINRIIKFFNKRGITEAALVGGIKKTRMFTDIRPDTKALSLLSSLKSTHDDGILRAFADVLEKNGIRITASTFLLPEILAPKGLWTRRKPDKNENADIALGWRLAKEIGRLDIGQCVVVAKGSVLAVEAIDGTDATIQRGGHLGKGNAVVVKVAKPNQDFRFDIPAVGVETLRNMHAAGCSVLVVEAGNAVTFDRVEMIREADQCGMTVLAMTDEDF
ncbi:UDP-2,3-diacylglucosamine diphosphatase LpxI [Desulfobacterales bacterium HSG17]|nr:UDP-2,3-diacylglucosamine diphosphatase LpxI [Desulfobacterales bacterium HSG17]